MNIKHLLFLTIIFLYGLPMLISCGNEDHIDNSETRLPNILIAISDNQSYPHAGAYGDKSVKTPGFDYVTEQGLLFHNAFSASPSGAPSRASILIGRYPWQYEEAGGHQTLYPAKYVTFPDVLEKSGYHIGYTGKGCAPFNWKQGGRNRDPTGPEYNSIRYDWADSIKITNKDMPDPEAFASNIATVNYAENFNYEN